MFQIVKYKDGMITAEFNKHVRPHLLELKRRYVQLNYFELMSFSSTYTQRVYTVAKSYEEPTGFGELLIDDFLDMVAVPEIQRKNFAYIRRKVLEQAVKEISDECAPLFFQWLPRIEKGRKVSHIQLYVGDKGKVLFEDVSNLAKVKADRIAARKARPPRLMDSAASSCRKKNGVKPSGPCYWWAKSNSLCKHCQKTAEVHFEYKQSDIRPASLFH